MGVLVKSGEYALAKLVNQFKDKVNRLIEISETEAIELGLTGYHGEPDIEPTGEPEQTGEQPIIEPTSEYEPTGEHINNDYKNSIMYIEALEDGTLIFNANKYKYKRNGFTCFYFKFNLKDSWKLHHYSDIYSYEYNIHTYQINKGDYIYFYTESDYYDDIYFPEINFNYKVCGNILSYNNGNFNLNIDEDQLNLNGREYKLSFNDKCLLCNIYVPEKVVLIINDQYYTNSYLKSHNTENYIYFKNYDLLVKKVTAKNINANYDFGTSMSSFKYDYYNNIFYTVKNNNCFILIDKQDLEVNNLYVDMSKSTSEKKYVETYNNIDYFSKYFYRLDLLINEKLTFDKPTKTNYNNIYILKNIDYNWNLESYIVDSYIHTSGYYGYEIDNSHKIINKFNNNDSRIKILEYNDKTFEILNL